MSALKAAAISPLVICVAAPFYAAWLYLQLTSTVPASPAAFAVVLRIASTWAAIFLPLAYLLVFTYGQLFHRVATAKGWAGPLAYAVAGAAPGAILLALPFSWQESVVPAVLFGSLVGLVFWRLQRPRRAAS